MPPEQWTTPTVQLQLTVRGGFCPKAQALEVKTVETPAGDLHFVRVEKNLEWVRKAAAGMVALKGALRRSNLLDDLRKKARTAVGDDNPAVAGPARDTGPAQPNDPMQMLEALDGDGARAEASGRRKRGRAPGGAAKAGPQRAYGMVRTLEVAEDEPTSHPRSQRRRQIRVLLHNTQAFWLEARDVPWMLKWMSDEHASGGVPDPEETPKKRQPNCSVPGVHICWDFDGAWQAAVVSGPAQGKSARSVVEKMTKEKYAAVAARHQLTTAFEDADAAERKHVTMLFLEMHMETVVGGGLDSQ